MELDKVLKESVDNVADNLFRSVTNSVSEVKAMQQRKAAENVQIVVKALKKIESDLQDKYDGITSVIEKRVSTIKDGKDGKDGKNGRDGKDGRNGKDGFVGQRGATGLDGRDGVDGQDGVSVIDANIDFDGSLIISLSNGRVINVGEVVAPDLAERIKVITNGGGTSQGVLDAIAALQATIATYGTMALQNANAVAITGGTINGTSVGATTASTGAFTTLNASGTTTLSGNSVISVTDNTNAALRITQLGTGNALLVEDTTNPDNSPFLIDAAGAVIKGSTSLYPSLGATPQVQVNGIGVGDSTVAVNSWRNSSGSGGLIALNHSKSGTIGTFAPLISGDSIGSMTFSGDDGTAFIQAASISAAVDGTPGTNDMPGRLVFSTTADGASTPTERIRIDSAGQTKFSYNAVVEVTDNTNAALRITQLGTGNALLVEDSTNPDSSPVVIDNNGNLISGYTTQFPTALTTASQVGVGGVASTSGNGVSILKYRNIATVGPDLEFVKSRSSTIGVNATVANTDLLGTITWSGADGTGYVQAASINAAVDGAPGTNDMPGRLVFSTTADGASTPTERVRIDSAGRLRQFGDTILSNVNVIGASYDSVSFSVAAEELTPTDLFFSPDGLKMYILGSSGDDVNEYNLSTAWVVSSAVFATNFSISAQETAPQGLFFRADGAKMYIVGVTNDTVFQYALTTPWSVATASYESISFSVATQDSSPAGLWFKPNGLSMYIVGSTGDAVYQYTLSTAWNVSTATFLQSFSVSSQETNPNGVTFTGDGSRMFLLGQIGDDVNVYNLTTPWDISTSVFVNVFSIAAQEDTPTGIYIKPDGTKMYIVGAANDTVFQYTVPSINIQLTGQTSVAALDVQQDLNVYGKFQAYKLSASSSILVTSPAGLGYGTGSGGAVTQLTSRTTGVTLSKPTGAITMFSAAGSAIAATFTVTNTLVAATDTIILNQKSGTNLYVLLVTAVAAGSFNVTFYTTGGVATDAPVINFSLIKGVTA